MHLNQFCHLNQFLSEVFQPVEKYTWEFNTVSTYILVQYFFNMIPLNVDSL